MKKVEVIVLLVIVSVLLISLSFNVLAQNEEIDKAYECLEDKVEDKCEDLSVEEQAFTSLAIGECSSELKDKSDDGEGECWPDGTCRLRDTALAVLAFDRVGKSTSDAEDWLLEQTETPEDLTWYLEIDADEETDCSIEYNDRTRTITIDEDKKINQGAGTCLSLAMDDYWLRIDDDCYEVNFTVSCDKDFLTTLLYKKDTGSTIYVSSQTESASAEGSTEHVVNTLCFGKNDCEYEGSLWAALALSKTGHDISQFIPYLIAMEDDNERYFPSAFLYIITDYDDYFMRIIEEQREDYWEITDSPYHRFYDTSLALLALYGLNADQMDDAKAYLLEVQGENGCWRDNIRDTAFILYAGWPRSVSIAGGGTMDYCEDHAYFCTSPLDCSQVDVLDNFVCFGGKVCCRTEPAEKTCEEKGGIICSSDQDCTGATVVASDTTNCCKGSCITKTTESECEEQGYRCRSYCLDNEEEKAYDCVTGVCCNYVGEEGSYLWVWILIILIVILAVAILFRKRLKGWISKGAKRGPPRPRPGFPPGPPGAMPRARPRMIVPRRPPARAPIRRMISKTDKELEDTFKKLKEMSK